ncbi:MAG: NADH-quinone oxidoreductase subunit C [Candidatus Devosia phytovorans]|uniref:NADH-quinone oxidoreductase subunit C n=1 Tax=Candidatus Devosia phytovorans TaxID=3121372 RepID=A0AAJ5VYF4_9HYPH|nr:NADH-quinone oxidoreductase subunit C [Devosia sp.]WEK06165.1 MAG: NADH-quinone oxidoreductase subunit C [Devosia sp.]
MDETIQVDPLVDLGEHIAGSLGTAVLAQEVAFGELTLTVERDQIVAVVTFLRDDGRCRFVSFVDVCGADYPARDERFDVVYHFMSPYLNQRIRVKVTADDVTPVPSITGVFKGAQWFEREAYDLYGMLFSGHDDLRRILTDYGFDGHPLRKDFPTTGFVEVRYDEERKRVVYEPVKLMQEYRSFDYLSPWEGTDYVLPGDEKAKP